MNKNKNYRIMKFFEPLEKECTGKGYIKVDMRGNRGTITVNVENLGDVKTSSEVFLFKNKTEKIKIGPINNKRGKLQRNILLNGKDEPIENYNICGVVTDGKIALYTPVFVPAQAKQLSILLQLEPDEEVEDKIFEEVKAEESENNTEKNEYCGEQNELNQNQEEPNTCDNDTCVESEQINNKTQNNSMYQARDNYNSKTVINGYQSVQNNMQNNTVNSKNEYYSNASTNNINANNANTNNENNVNNVNNNVQNQAVHNKTQNTYKSEYERNLYNLLNTFEPIQPLAHNIECIKWWKVNYDEKSIYKGFLPYFNQIISSYYPYPLTNHVTTCQSLMQKHGYYLFGMYEEDGKITKFVYGVPGKFTREEQPYRGVTGFKNWSYKNTEIDGDYGYWLAFINATTGSIAEPPEVE